MDNQIRVYFIWYASLFWGPIKETAICDLLLPKPTLLTIEPKFKNLNISILPKPKQTFLNFKVS